MPDSATSDHFYRQINQLRASCVELQNVLDNGRSTEPYLTRVKNGMTNVQKANQQLLEEGDDRSADPRYKDVREQVNLLMTRLNLPTY